METLEIKMSEEEKKEFESTYEELTKIDLTALPIEIQQAVMEDKHSYDMAAMLTVARARRLKRTMVRALVSSAIEKMKG